MKGRSHISGDPPVARLDELHRAIKAYDRKFKEPIDWIADYKATLAAMREFERVGFGTRLVFWFDN